MDSCLSLQLIDDFEKHINNFRLSYLQLGISVTPKVHSVFFHIEYFCNKHEKSLGYFSEQAMKAVHSDFKNTWNDFKVNEVNEKYYDQLKRVVSKYNSLHV